MLLTCDANFFDSASTTNNMADANISPVLLHMSRLALCLLNPATLPRTSCCTKTLGSDQKWY